MYIQIKHRYTGDVIFESDAASVKLAVVDAVSKNISLSGADLSGQDLSNIKLQGGVFDGSSFDGSHFVRSSFDGSRFVNSSFDGSSFDGCGFFNCRFDNSSFNDSSFDHASFLESSFVRCHFVGSIFIGSSFFESRFDRSYFLNCRFLESRFFSSRFVNCRFDNSIFDRSTAESIASSWPEAKQDLFKVLNSASDEVPGLLQALREGKVDGSVYEGECACLVGTIANLRHCHYQELRGLKPDPNHPRPAERWFLGIRKGDTPGSNPIVGITCEWIEEWRKAHA